MALGIGTFTILLTIFSGRKESVEGMGMMGEARRARAEAAQLARENATLRDTVLALHSELFGAR